MTLTRRAVLTQALTASAASVAARASPLPAAAHPGGKAAGPGAGAPAGVESDLPAAERLLGLAYKPAQRKQLARGYGAVLKELAGVRALDLPNEVSPALRFDPRIPGKTYRLPTPGIRGTAPDAGPFPASAVDVALAPAWKQAAWLRAKRISSVELTRLYLDRIGRLAPELHNFITVTDDLALKQAASADADIAKGRIRSGLHGVPYGIKDLFDVAHVRTTWGADKVGPIARSVTDCALTLDIINGPDSRDWGSIDAPLGWDWQAGAKGLRVGYVPEWFEGKDATPVDRHALDALRETGAQVVEVRLPDIKYGLLTPLVFLEAAAAFADLTLTHRDEELKWQADMAWPNTWRRAHLFPAVEMVQIERLRRQAMVALDGFFDGLDAVIGPAYGGDSLVATNATGIPCLVMKAGFLELPTRRIDDKPVSAHAPKHRVPHAICLWSALFREDVLITLGRALEAVLGVADQNPPLALS